MHEADERPRLRWRLLSWTLGAIVLLPVLYVAATGPAAWWSGHHFRYPAWMAAHGESLDPLYQHPQTRAALDQYRGWWLNLPAPRSWRRQYLADDLADARAKLDGWDASFKQWEERRAAIVLRLDSLNSLTHHTPEQSLEATDLRLQLERFDRELNALITGEPPSSEGRVKAAEDALRAFDAQRR